MLEDPSLHRPSLHLPRASLLLAAGEAANRHTEIWMGGAHSLVGETLEVSALSTSWLIDCAGDIDHAYRRATARFVACVFPDLDGPLASSNRVAGVVEEVLAATTQSNGSAPERVYIMCQHGMNRSGLVSGLVLRGLGIEGREAVNRIRLARPGALANEYFRHLLLRE